jgi:hypothetical protein
MKEYPQYEIKYRLHVSRMQPMEFSVKASLHTLAVILRYNLQDYLKMDGHNQRAGGQAARPLLYRTPLVNVKQLDSFYTFEIVSRSVQVEIN